MLTFRSYCYCPPQIAEHVDSTDGFLSKLSLYKALALIALAQQGRQPSPKLLENCIEGRAQCHSDGSAVNGFGYPKCFQGQTYLFLCC